MATKRRSVLFKVVSSLLLVSLCFSTSTPPLVNPVYQNLAQPSSLQQPAFSTLFDDPKVAPLLEKLFKNPETSDAIFSQFAQKLSVRDIAKRLSKPLLPQSTPAQKRFSLLTYLFSALFPFLVSCATNPAQEFAKNAKTKPVELPRFSAGLSAAQKQQLTEKYGPEETVTESSVTEPFPTEKTKQIPTEEPTQKQQVVQVPVSETKQKEEPKKEEVVQQPVRQQPVEEPKKEEIKQEPKVPLQEEKVKPQQITEEELANIQIKQPKQGRGKFNPGLDPYFEKLLVKHYGKVKEANQAPSVDIDSNSKKFLTGIYRWIKTRIKKNYPQALPESHPGDPSRANVAFTYDLAHTAQELIANGDLEDAYFILNFFVDRYPFTEAAINRARNLEDGNHVKGVFRFLPTPSDGAPRPYIVNTTDTRNFSEFGEGINEWYTDGGPQFWLGQAVLNYLMANQRMGSSDREKFEQFVQAMVTVGMRLRNSESVVAAGPQLQKTNERESERDRLGHVENMEDFYALLVEGANYFEHKQSQLAEKYRQTAEEIIQGLKQKGIYKEEGNRAWFWQGFAYGRLNQQIPTDVQSWGILAFGPHKIDAVWGKGAAEKIYNTLVQTMLVQTEFIRADGRKVVTIGADYGDPYRPDFVQQRGGVIGTISDEWTGGVIVAFDVMAEYFADLGNKAKAEEALAMADALRYFAILRAFESNDGDIALPYATEINIYTGFGWPTPNTYTSIAGAWIINSLKRINPFDGNRKVRDHTQLGIRRLGVLYGIKLLTEKMRTNNIFTPDDVTLPDSPLQKMDMKQLLAKVQAKTIEGFRLLEEQHALTYYPPERIGLVETENKEEIAVKVMRGDWNTMAIKQPTIGKFPTPKDLSQYSYLTFEVKSTGVSTVDVAMVPLTYLKAANFWSPPPTETIDIPNDGKWHRINIPLEDYPSQSITEFVELSFQVVKDGNPTGAVLYVRNPTFTKKKIAHNDKPVPPREEDPTRRDAFPVLFDPRRQTPVQVAL